MTAVIKVSPLYNSSNTPQDALTTHPYSYFTPVFALTNSCLDIFRFCFQNGATLPPFQAHRVLHLYSHTMFVQYI